MKILLLSFLMICLQHLLAAQNDIFSYNLNGKWKFAIGDNIRWADLNFDDSDWDIIRAPRSWEDEGFNGYNGYAWYRKSFTIPQELAGKPIYIRLGRIDDVDQVYCNGNLIGASGSFPPNYFTAYDVWREYKIPTQFIKYGVRNVIAIRVYDAQLEGGIVEGPLSIDIMDNALQPDYSLDGFWSFIPEDDPEFSNPAYSPKGWKQITVPAFWESQGFANYDGIGWYRKNFVLPKYLAGKDLVLLLGKIDDIDEAFINGYKIGNTGVIEEYPQNSRFDQEWQQLRGYYIPGGLLKENGENVIAVRVYDGYLNGGIWDGPIGLITQQKYQNFWKNVKKSKKSFLEWLFDR